MDNDKPKKKWVSSRLKDKKKELGIPDKEPSPVQNKEKKNSRKVNRVRKNNYEKKSSDKFNSRVSRPNNRNRDKHVIRISNLPDDITNKELIELVSEWGEIGNVNIKIYSDSVSAYIDFYNKYEADYFVEALHATPFGHLIINVEIMKFDNKKL